MNRNKRRKLHRRWQACEKQRVQQLKQRIAADDYGSEPERFTVCVLKKANKPDKNRKPKNRTTRQRGQNSPSLQIKRIGELVVFVGSIDENRINQLGFVRFKHSRQYAGYVVLLADYRAIQPSQPNFPIF